MRIRDWSSDVCSSDLLRIIAGRNNVISAVATASSAVARRRERQIQGMVAESFSDEEEDEEGDIDAGDKVSIMVIHFIFTKSSSKLISSLVETHHQTDDHINVRYNKSKKRNVGKNG